MPQTSNVNERTLTEPGLDVVRRSLVAVKKGGGKKKNGGKCPPGMGTGGKRKPRPTKKKKGNK